MMAKKKAQAKKLEATAEMPSRKAVEAKRSRKRVRIGEARNILNVEGIDKGFTARWVNDVDGKIADMQARGYEFVTNNDGDLMVGDEAVDYSEGVGSVVTKNMGKGVTGVLMAQRNDYYEEDQRDKAEQIAKREAALTADAKADGRYGKIEIN